MKVCKFGGSSLADAKQVGKVCDIIEADPGRRIVVVSAPGKRNKDDSKVTDLLIECAELKLSGKEVSEKVNLCVDRFVAIQKDFGLSASIIGEIALDLEERLASDATDKDRFFDVVKAWGEDSSAKIVAAALCHRGLDAHYLSPHEGGLLLSREHGNARILPESYDNLALLRNAEGVTVFPGFFGYTRDGDVVTFSRGGSDITGSILAKAVGAEVYENFTDVDSVCAVDPDFAPGIEPIPELTYREMRELSYAGFGVLHDEAVLPAVEAGIPICIKNTNNPKAPGTRIVSERNVKPGSIVGIAYNTGFCAIQMSKYLMNRELGFGRRLLEVFEKEKISFEHMPSGIDTISLVIKEQYLDPMTEQRLLSTIKKELEVDTLYIDRHLALIMIAGEGMRNAVGIMAKASRAFADAGVSIEMIDQGASEISVMFGVNQKDCAQAVRSLYEAFFGKKRKTTDG